MKHTLNLLKLTFIATLIITAFSSCSKDTDPADVDLFVGTYNGSISYSKADEEIKSIENGKITVVKVNDTYRFDFSDGIPTISGVKFEKGEDNTYVSIGSGVTGITINENKLIMLVINGDEIWTADCTR